MPGDPMRSPIVIALLALLALTPLAAAEEGPGGGTAPQTTRPAPGFVVMGNAVVGSLVSFTYVPEGGPLRDFAYIAGSEGRSGAWTIFQAVTVPGYRGTAAPLVAGDIFQADGGVANVTVHDGPSALLQVETRGPGEVVFLLAPGAEVEGEDSAALQGLQCVALDKPVRGAILTPDGSMVIQGDQVVASLAGPGTVFFRIVPQDGEGSPGDEHAVCQAIAERRVGAEVNIGLLGGSPQVDSVAYRPDAKVVVTTVARRHLELRVKGERPEGTRIFLRLDPSVATAADARTLRVTLDGQVVPSASLTDVLYARGSAPQDALYAALVQGPGLGLLAYIPHLSPGGVALTIDALAPYTLVVDLPTLGVMALGVAVVAVATLALFRRRR